MPLESIAYVLLSGVIAWPAPSLVAAQDSRPTEWPIVESHQMIRDMSGAYATETFGFKVRNLGDVDGDEVADFAVAATGRDNGSLIKAGAVDVYSGASGSLLHSYPGHFAAGHFGNGIGLAGDVNADGIPDVVVGSYDKSDTLIGYAAIFSGHNGLTHHILKSGRSGDRFGIQAHGTGDLDGDGHADVIVGAPNDSSEGELAGRAYVFSGRTGQIMFTLKGEKPGDHFGSGVAGDSYDHSGLFAVGARDAGPEQQGRVYVYRVRNGEPTVVFTIDPVSTSNELGAYFMSVVGDVDADGTPDIFASDYADSKYGDDSGRVFIHSGATGARLFEFEGRNSPGGFGTGFGRAGDVNLDGHDDIIVGSWNNGEQAISAGKCHLFSGKDGTLLATYTGRHPGRTFGSDAIGLGDINGDGVADLLITNAGNSNGLPREIGHAYFFTGPGKATAPD